METKASAVMLDLSPNSVSDPEEKEVSEEDDDDRNHKHRRRETSQSLEVDASESTYARTDRKRRKPFDNGFQGRIDSQEDKDSSSRFDKRRYGLSRGRFNQPNHGEAGMFRGRGRDFRFNHLDGTAQIAQQGSVNPNMFGGIGLSNVANPSWNAFGLVPGMPNAGLETLHSFAFQPNMRPNVKHSMNVGISRPRCRDFEEQGFCLRGDMCPMEHGVNRIVVEDVQSLSQFNLPVPLAAGQLLAAPVKPAVISSSTAQPSTSASKVAYGKSNKGSMNDSTLTGNGAYPGGPDVYDPDEPLWNEGPENSAINVSKNDSTQQFSASDRHLDNEIQARNSEVSDESHLTVSAIWGKDGKHLPRLVDSSMASNIKRHQKAQRTLFVNGVPLKSNRKEILLAHFQKFGQVIDIYIPVNSERAFVQFRKREEAEAALISPDAVMGNRFIKLLWANRDNIPDDISTADNLNANSRSHAMKRAGNSAPRSSTTRDSDSDQSKLGSVNGSKIQPPWQKKIEIEQLKEELRKKQELLEQKRNNFRLQLSKFEKQSGGGKNVDVTVDRSEKKPKTTADEENGTDSTSPRSEMSGEKTKSVFASASVGKEQATSKLPNRPRTPFSYNRYKLDNRPTSIKILSPLPSDLKSVDALTEHFSTFGDVGSVELDNNEPGNVVVDFLNRHSAEKAFQHGKLWKGHGLKFAWVSSRNSVHESETVSDHSSRDNDVSDEAIAKGIERDVISLFESLPKRDDDTVARISMQEDSPSGENFN